MHCLQASLNKLLKKTVSGFGLRSARKHLKKVILTSDLFLTHYDPKKEIIVASDARSHGIGACIMHKLKDGSIKPIAYVSKTLLPAEKNYSGIEKESLRIVFALKKFN